LAWISLLDKHRMGSGGRGAPVRIQVVYGTESGNAKRNIENLVKKWSKENTNLEFASILDGNSAASKIKDGSLASSCDVLLISTSSFGEGDPPSNFAAFLLELYRAAKSNEMPLKGLQHGVIGFGASVYETFQNTPRLTDKLLGESGSRRMVQRAEVDEASEDDPYAAIKQFERDVSQALKSLPSVDSAPVCAWTTPGKQILEISEESLSNELFSAGGAPPALIIAGAVAAAGAAYWAYTQGYF